MDTQTSFSKKILIPLVIVVIAAGIWYFSKDSSETPDIENLDDTPAAADPLNATYIIESEKYIFINGESEKEIEPGSATKIETRIFSVPTTGDLDADGDNDAAFFIQQNPGGTGTFYYLAVAINNNGKYTGTNAIWIGDRIAPQMVEIKNGQVIANYADRAPDEPFSESPSIAKSFYARLKAGELVPID